MTVTYYKNVLIYHHFYSKHYTLKSGQKFNKLSEILTFIDNNP